MGPTTKSSHSALTTFAAALLGLAMILLLKRYSGIQHDSILYLGEGLQRRWPEIFRNDLFFAFGGQDRYTLFPWLLGASFRWLTPPQVFLWGTLLSLLLFAAASWFCLRPLLAPKQRYWAWLAILCLPSMYGVVRIFAYNEQFLTSRPFSESLCLISIGFMARNRPGIAIAFLFAAALFHPLQTVGASLVIWSYAVIRDKRWLHAMWLAIPALLLAALGIHPFNGLIQQIDPAWLQRVRASNQLFITDWNINDYKFLAFDGFMLVTAWCSLSSPFKNWCGAAAIGLLLGVLASLVLADGLHLVLPTGLQLWRAHWLAHWFSIAALSALIYNHLREKSVARALLLILAAQLAWGETDWGWLAITALYVTWPWLIKPPRAGLQKPMAWLFGIALTLLLANHCANELKWFREAGSNIDIYPLDRRLLYFPAVALGLPLLGWHLWERSNENVRRVLFAFVLLPLLALGMYLWDSRWARVKDMEQAAFNTRIFGVAIPEDAQIYWDAESPIGTWLILRRSNYFSSGQIAGQVFSRANAMEGMAREIRMAPLDHDVAHCFSKNLTESERAHCHVSDENMRHACAPGAPTPPDYIVLPLLQPQKPEGDWPIAGLGEKKSAVVYYLYKCANVMKELDQ